MIENILGKEIVASAKEWETKMSAPQSRHVMLKQITSYFEGREKRTKRRLKLLLK